MLRAKSAGRGTTTPLGVEDADDGDGDVPEKEALADRVFVAEQTGYRASSENPDGDGMGHVGVAQEPPPPHLERLDLPVVGSSTENPSVLDPSSTVLGVLTDQHEGHRPPDRRNCRPDSLEVLVEETVIGTSRLGLLAAGVFAAAEVPVDLRLDAVRFSDGIDNLQMGESAAQLLICTGLRFPFPW